MKVRIYRTRYKRVRAIVHDGTRWRRLDEWAVDTSRRRVKWGEYGDVEHVLNQPATITLTAPGFDHVHVDELVQIN